MELLLIAMLGLGAYFYFKSQHPAIPALADIPVDAIQLLDFTPFVLRQGPLTVLYIAPKGFTPQIVAQQLTNTSRFNMMSTPVLRKTVPIPGPTIVPAFADLWEVKGNYTGDTAGNAPVTPALLLKDVIGDKPPVPGMPVNRQLAAILYATAMLPVIDPTKLWPIAAVSPISSTATTSGGSYIQGYQRYSSRYWPRY